ncbi:hypothetical protein [Gymnodinialimonas hymeniacidonis]|uniref:hypothetical protein n=1 Tax=Gymnodinialimonas hymeniacidonis TaxID=3126508 RepID=UPI0034C61AE6
MRKTLPMFDGSHGNAKPFDGLFLIAALGSSNFDEIMDTHSMMKGLQEQDRDSATNSSRTFLKKIILDDETNKMHAGHVVLEISSFYLRTGEFPTLDKTYKLVATETAADEGKPATASLPESIRKAFKRYRPTSHYLAAWALDPDVFFESGFSATKADHTLRLIKWFETTLDHFFEVHSSSQ